MHCNWWQNLAFILKRTTATPKKSPTPHPPGSTGVSLQYYKLPEPLLRNVFWFQIQHFLSAALCFFFLLIMFCSTLDQVCLFHEDAHTKPMTSLVADQPTVARQGSNKTPLSLPKLSRIWYSKNTLKIKASRTLNPTISNFTLHLKKKESSLSYSNTNAIILFSFILFSPLCLTFPSTSVNTNSVF